MNAIATNLITNVNLFLEDKTTLGQVKELKIPVLKWAMKDREALGMVGKIKLPLGIEPLEGDLTFNSFYPEAMKRLGRGKKFHSLIAMGSLESFDSSGLTEEAPLVVTMNAHFSEIPFGSFKQQENVEWATKMIVYAIEQKINGEPILKFNAMANIYEVAGEDILTKYRANLGG